MKLKIWVSTNKVGSTVETEIDIPDATFEGMTQEEIDAKLEETAKEEMFNLIEWSYEEI